MNHLSPLSLSAQARRTWLRSAILAPAALALGLSLPLSGLQAKQFSSPVISVAQLQPLLQTKSVKVLDIRELLQPDQKTPIYAAGHIPGALPAPYSAFRGSKDNPGGLPAEDKLSAFLGSLGVTPQTPLVIAGPGKTGTDFGAAARVYWTLKVSGFSDLAVLDGGLTAWTAAKLPLETGMPTRTSTTVQVKYDRSQIVSVDEVKTLTAAGDKAPSRLIDARPEAFYKGDIRHPASARWGTLPGAENADSEIWFVPKTGTLLPTEQIKAIAQQKGLLASADTVSFCNTGHWAATNWFILSEVLGQTGARMYPESMVAWSKAGLPMENEPGRAVVLFRQLTGGGLPK
jgi:thiosulfate/3-mercaptopyruvate sulfurtransferase